MKLVLQIAAGIVLGFAIVMTVRYLATYTLISYVMNETEEFVKDLGKEIPRIDPMTPQPLQLPQYKIATFPAARCENASEKKRNQRRSYAMSQGIHKEYSEIRKLKRDSQKPFARSNPQLHRTRPPLYGTRPLRALWRLVQREGEERRAGPAGTASQRRNRASSVLLCCTPYSKQYGFEVCLSYR